MGFYAKVAILDCIGFDLADPRGSAISVRFAKCLVDEAGRIERQYQNDRLVCHRVTLYPWDDIDAKLQDACRQLALMGYDPPTQQMIDRVNAHCTVEWGITTIAVQPVAITYDSAVPFDISSKGEAGAWEYETVTGAERTGAH